MAYALLGILPIEMCLEINELLMVERRKAHKLSHMKGHLVVMIELLQNYSDESLNDNLDMEEDEMLHLITKLNIIINPLEVMMIGTIYQ